MHVFLSSSLLPFFLLLSLSYIHVLKDVRAKKSNGQQNQVILPIVTFYPERYQIGEGRRNWEPGIFCGFYVIVGGEPLLNSAGEPDKRSAKPSQWPKSF